MERDNLIKKFIKRKSLPYWTNFTVSIIGLMGILVILNVIVSKKYLRIDLTEEKLFSLSDQSIKVLKELEEKTAKDENLEIISFYREKEGESAGIKDLLESYSYRTSKIKWKFVDPEKNPAEASRYGVTNLGTIVLILGQRNLKLQDANVNEGLITNAILKLLREKNPKLCFTEGHGEKDIDDTTNKIGLGSFKKSLQDEGFEVGKIKLWEKDSLVGCAVVVVSAPVKTFAKEEIDALREFLLIGGKAFFLVEPDTYTGIEDLVSLWGVKIDDSVVVDLASRLLGGNPMMPVITEYDKSHEITKDFHAATFMFFARRVFSEKTVEGVEKIEIAKTSVRSWAEKDYKSESISFDQGKDVQGPVPVVVAAEGIPGTKGEVVYGTMAEHSAKKARIVVAGDSDFISNQLLDLAANRDLGINIINWLAEQGELISIRPKERKGGKIIMTPGQGKLVFWLSVVVMPLIMLFGAIFAYIRKRKR